MAKKIHNEDYLYASGRLHAMSVRSFGAAHAERMIDAKTDEEALKVLNEVGITPDETGEFLSKARAERFAELSAFLPDERLLRLFRLRYDYHNLKSALKSPHDWELLYSPDGELSLERVESICFHEEYDGLEPEMKEGIVDARGIFNRTGDPQLLDFRLDRAQFAEMKALSDSIGSSFIAGYVSRMADAANLKIYIRAKRLGRGRDTLERALIPGGTVSTEPLLDDETGENLEKVFGATMKPALGAAKAALEKTGGVSAMERLCEQAIRTYIDDASRQSFGEAVALAYMYRFEDTLSKIRIILAGRRAGLSPAAIRERL